MSDDRSVLLVMDYQHGTVDRFGSSETIGAAVRAIQAARANGIPVMFVRVAFRPGYPEVASSNLAFSSVKANAGDAMLQDSAATQIHASVIPLAHEPVIIKRRISAFTGSDLDVLLRGCGAESLVMIGMTTSGVVLSTLRQAADLDYACTVLSDACTDPDADVQQLLMGTIFPRQATVTTTDEWIAAL